MFRLHFAQMLLSDSHDNVESYRVEGERDTWNPLFNTSEAELEKTLQEIRGRNDTIHNKTYPPSHD